MGVVSSTKVLGWFVLHQKLLKTHALNSFRQMLMEEHVRMQMGKTLSLSPRRKEENVEILTKEMRSSRCHSEGAVLALLV